MNHFRSTLNYKNPSTPNFPSIYWLPVNGKEQLIRNVSKIVSEKNFIYISNINKRLRTKENKNLILPFKAKERVLSINCTFSE